VLLVAMLLVLAAQRWLARVPAPSASRPNLLLVTVDTLRADELGAYGLPLRRSPELDRLARRSTVYEMAVAPAPWTLPSIASIMTGLEPKAHGAILFRRALPEAVPTLAERLRGLGYHTSAAVTHFVLGPEYGFDRGFERFDRGLIPASDQEAHLSVTSEALTATGLELLRSAEEPYFVWLHYFDPHFHYLAHPPDTVAADPGFGGRNLYRGEVRFTDRALGELLASAAAMPRPPLVVFTADHGEQFFEHRGWQHTTAVYQEVVHVPLLVHRPDQTQARIVPGPKRLVDVYALLLGLAGAAQTAEAFEAPILLHTQQAADLRAIVAGRYKLIADLRAGRLELYDLFADPGERHDLAAELPEVVARLCGSMAGHFEELGRRDAALRTAAREVDLSPERNAQLESLGYTAAGPSAEAAAEPEIQALCSLGREP
jgi:arylsulfatase A-like enzyme